MRCINDILLSETLLAIFKCLEIKEVVKVREVCKQWWKLVDENRTFWRILVLSERSLERIQSTVSHFDEKSGSTLEEVSTIVKKYEDSQDFNQLTGLVLNSSQTLQAFWIKLQSDVFQARAFLTIFEDSLLLMLPNLVDFRIWSGDPKVQLLVQSSRNRHGSLRILWVTSLQLQPPVHLHVSHPILFQALVSLQMSKGDSHSTFRCLLSHCSQTLKHLTIFLRQPARGQEVLPLQFARLEVLQLWMVRIMWDCHFPTWMAVPPTLKHFCP